MSLRRLLRSMLDKAVAFKTRDLDLAVGREIPEREHTID